MTPTLELRKLIRELASITGPETTGVALVAVSDGEIKVRTFGEKEPLHRDLKTASEYLSRSHTIDDIAASDREIGIPD